MAAGWTERSNPAPTAWEKLHQTLGITIAQLTSARAVDETISHFTEAHGIQISEMINQGAAWTQVSAPTPTSWTQVSNP